MKRFLSILLITSIVITTPAFAWAKKTSDCHPDGEFIDSSSEKPDGWIDWRDKSHFTDTASEYYVGISTQNKKLEDGKHLATEEAKNIVLDSIGELVQFKNQGVVTMDDTKMHNAWGSLKAPAFLKNKDVADWYYEKWASYSKCQASFYYNVWVLMKLPKGELQAEKQKALTYLEEAQKKEMAKESPELMPDSKLRVDERIQKIKTIDQPAVAQANYLEEMQKMDAENSTKKPLYKKAVFWVATGLVIAGGATAGVLLGRSSGSGSGTTGGTNGGTGSLTLNVPLPQ